MFRWATQLSKQIAKRGLQFDTIPCSLNVFYCKHSWGWWFQAPSRSLWCHCNVNKTSCFSLSTNIDEQNFCMLYLLDSNSVVNSKSWLYKVSKICTGMRKHISITCLQWSIALVFQLEFPSKVNRSYLENSWIVKHAYSLISMNKK